METLRLDPADPLASVLRWLVALAQTLQIDLSLRAADIRLNHASAAVVRAQLAAWSRQLRALIRIDAARLARRLRMSFERAGGTGRHGARARQDRPRLDLFLPRLRGRWPKRAKPAEVGGGTSRRSPLSPLRGQLPRMRGSKGVTRATVAASGRSAHAIRPSPADLLDPVEEAALKRRTRAVITALLDRSAVVRRLARRLARTAQAVDRPSLPHPPRVLAAARSAPARKPELRPPNGNSSVF